MIKVREGATSSGKTFLTTKKAIEFLNKGQTTLIFEPTHAVGESALRECKKHGLSRGYAVQLVGKNNGCLLAHEKTPCSRCPVFKEHQNRWLQPEQNSSLEESIAIPHGEVFDLPKLKDLGIQLSICPLMLSRILSTMPGPKIVVAPHAYLVNSNAMHIISKIQVDHIFVDEMDQLSDALLSNHQYVISLMEPRLNKSNTIRGACDRNCNDCRPHLVADENQSKWKPFTGRVESLHGISDINNLRESISNIIDPIEKGVNDGHIRDIFDFDEIRIFFDEVTKILDCYREGDSSRKLVINITNHQETLSLGMAGQMVIPIKVGKVCDETFDEAGDLDDPSMWINSVKGQIFTSENPDSAVIKTFEKQLLPFLGLIHFLYRAPGYTYLIPEERSNGDQGPQRCRILLRHLDVEPFGRVTNFLDNRSRLISGTLFDRDLTAASLLLPVEQIDFKSAEVPLPNSILIIVHNPKSLVDPSPQKLTDLHMIELYKDLQKEFQDIKVLQFAKNSTLANKSTFEAAKTDPDFVKVFKIEQRLRDYVLQDLGGSHEDGYSRPGLFCIDKLRSSTSRGVNRDQFDVCAVFGNGIANWTDRVTLSLEVQKINSQISLQDLVQYEQIRAVVQALMRAPRSGKRTVCFYVGNLHRQAFPKYMRERILTTQDLLRSFNLPEPCKVETQLKAISTAMKTFLKGESIFLRPEKQPPIWEQFDGRQDATKERIEHVEKCIEDKGFVDLVKDKKGERPHWRSFIEWLEAEGFLKKEKRGRKTVYVKTSKVSG